MEENKDYQKGETPGTTARNRKLVAVLRSKNMHGRAEEFELVLAPVLVSKELPKESTKKSGSWWSRTIGGRSPSKTREAIGKGIISNSDSKQPAERDQTRRGCSPLRRRCHSHERQQRSVSPAQRSGLEEKRNDHPLQQFSPASKLQSPLQRISSNHMDSDDNSKTSTITHARNRASLFSGRTIKQNSSRDLVELIIEDPNCHDNVGDSSRSSPKQKIHRSNKSLSPFSRRTRQQSPQRGSSPYKNETSQSLSSRSTAQQRQSSRGRSPNFPSARHLLCDGSVERNRNNVGNPPPQESNQERNHNVETPATGRRRTLSPLGRLRFWGGGAGKNNTKMAATEQSTIDESAVSRDNINKNKTDESSSSKEANMAPGEATLSSQTQQQEHQQKQQQQQTRPDISGCCILLEVQSSAMNISHASSGIAITDWATSFCHVPMFWLINCDADVDEKQQSPYCNKSSSLSPSISPSSQQQQEQIGEKEGCFSDAASDDAVHPAMGTTESVGRGYTPARTIKTTITTAVAATSGSTASPKIQQEEEQQQQAYKSDNSKAYTTTSSSAAPEATNSPLYTLTRNMGDSKEEGRTVNAIAAAVNRRKEQTTRHANVSRVKWSLPSAESDHEEQALNFVVLDELSKEVNKNKMQHSQTGDSSNTVGSSYSAGAKWSVGGSSLETMFLLSLDDTTVDTATEMIDQHQGCKYLPDFDPTKKLEAVANTIIGNPNLSNTHTVARTSSSTSTTSRAMLMPIPE